MANVWRELNRALPDATDIGATIISATVVPGHKQLIVIGDQHDGRYSIVRISPRREEGVLVWKTLDHLPDLILQDALDRVPRMIMSAHAVAVQLADIEERMKAPEPS